MTKTDDRFNRYYSLSLKQEVKKKLLEGAKILDLSKEYGIAPGTLSKWKNDRRIRVTYCPDAAPKKTKAVKASEPTITKAAHNAEVAFLVNEKLELENQLKQRDVTIAELQKNLNVYERYTERLKETIVVFAMERYSK